MSSASPARRFIITNLREQQPPPPQPVQYTYDYITNNPNLQAICLEIISGLFTKLNEIRQQYHRFFLRGTNVSPFIKHGFIPEYKFPYHLTSDFDCEVLINPYLDSKTFSAYHKLLLDEVFKYLITIVKRERYWPFVTSAAPLEDNYPIVTTINEYTPLNTLAKNIGKYNNIPKNSPFYLYKVNELYVLGKSTNISQVKLGIRIPNSNPKYPFKSLDLIDISIPKQDNEYIKTLWELTTDSLMLYSEDIPLSRDKIIHVEFPRLDLASAVLNLEYAANPIRESREEKRIKRISTAKNLRNFYKSHATQKHISGGNRTKRRARK